MMTMSSSDAMSAAARITCRDPRVSYVPAFADVAPDAPALSWRHDPGERRRLPQLASALAVLLQEPEQLGQRPTEDAIPSPGVSSMSIAIAAKQKGSASPDS